MAAASCLLDARGYDGAPGRNDASASLGVGGIDDAVWGGSSAVRDCLDGGASRHARDIETTIRREAAEAHNAAEARAVPEAGAVGRWEYGARVSRLRETRWTTSARRTTASRSN